MGYTSESLLHSLPWVEEDPRNNTAPATALGMYVARLKGKSYTEVTVGEVQQIFASAHENGGQLPRIRNFGQKSLGKTYNVFGRVGIELAQVRV